MNMLLCLAAVLFELAGAVGKNWAVLVAGSNGWGNYRHQADVCHSFHILHDIGKIPAEQIVVMMADDIAFNEENPFQGNIINIPNGPNVYPGVNKNVTGEAVTAENFLKVLHELPSDDQDNVFIYFTDHGAKGLVAMPFGDPLYADELNAALKEMHKSKKYNELVIYVEACESGSMFDGLLSKKLNIYATTASDDDHSSYAFYFDEKRGVYLADLYSINWMQDSQTNMTSEETLKTQFELVKLLTNESTVEEFGDLRIQKEPVENFQAEDNFMFNSVEGTMERRRIGDKHLRKLTKMFHRERISAKHWSKVKDAEVRTEKPVDSRNVVVSTLINQLKVAHQGGDSDMASQLEEDIRDEFIYRRKVKKAFANIVKLSVDSMNSYPQLPSDLSYWFDMKAMLTNYDCLRMMVKLYQKHCYKGLEDYSLKYIRVFGNLCTKYELVENNMNDIVWASC